VQNQFPEALLQLIDDSSVTDICLTPGLTQVDKGNGLVLEDSLHLNEDQLSTLAKDLIELGGRRLDQANPFADVSLPGGIRVHAVLKSGCSEASLISIRLHSQALTDLEALLSGLATTSQAELIQEISSSGESFLISGATGTGKTTLLRSMLAERAERVIAVEDVTELQGANIICLQSRPKNIEGQGEITLEALVKQALRMRPDRICIGEVRGEELIVMLQALNTGHRGATTLHANSLEQVPERLLSIASALGMPDQTLAKLAASAFDWVIALSSSQGKRRVSGIGKFQLVDGQLVVFPSLRNRKLQLA
jgi:pilus assembly protein CpaF